MSDESIEPGTIPGAENIKSTKSKPIKVLPTDRLGFEKQLGVLRGYAAASGAERKAVSNKEVGAIVQVHENTVSICNPFLQDVCLLTKDGQRNRPSDEVADYAQAYEWDAEKAAHKLAAIFRKAWFGTALIPKLTFRALSKDEAITFLASEAKAPKEYKTNLEIILDYLKAAGVIQSDGSTITLGPNAKEPSENGLPNGKQQNSVNDQNPNTEIISRVPAQPELYMEPLIMGLIQKLPRSSEIWALADRAKWLNAAANIFDLMYEDEDQSGITVTLEAKTLSIRKG